MGRTCCLPAWSWTSPTSQEMDPPGCSLLPASPFVGQQQLSYFVQHPEKERSSNNSTERSPSVIWQALIRPGTCGGFAWFYLGIHSETRHGGGPPRDSVVLSVHGKVAATVRGLHSLKLPNLWLLEINTQPSSWDGLGTGQGDSPACSARGTI